MTVASKALIQEAYALVGDRLTRAGFQRRKDEIYTTPIRPDVLGWVGLNRTAGWGSAELAINPGIGVRYQPLEKLLAELLGEKAAVHSPPTLFTPLGYVMPQKTHKPWVFAPGADNGATADDLVKALVEWGRPFQETHADLRQLALALTRTESGYPEQLAFRAPLAAYLLGDKVGAATLLQERTAALGERTDLYAQQYRRFAEALRGRLEQG